MKKVIIIILFLAFIFIAIALPIKAYSETPYIIDRAVTAHLDYASKLTDVKAIGDELEMALKNLEPYHGNPRWIFPTVKTDIDYIKLMIKSQLDMAREVEKLPPSDYAYQRFIENCIRTIPELKDNVDSYTFWLFANPSNTCLALIWIVLFAIFIITIIHVWGEE